MTTLHEVHKFLLGEGPLDGIWYSDPHPTEHGAFWWRKHLLAALAQQGEPVAWHSDDWKIICRAEERIYWKSVAKNPLYAAAPAAQPEGGASCS